MNYLEELAQRDDQRETDFDMQSIGDQLQQYPEMSAQRMLDADTLLHHSAQLQLPRASELLLRHGADPNAVTREQREAPIHRLLTGQPEWFPSHERLAAIQTAEALLANGADPNLLTRDGDTPLSLAIDKGYQQIARLLQKRGARLDFRSAVLLGNTETVQRLLDEADDPDSLIRRFPQIGYDALSSIHHSPSGSIATAEVLHLLFRAGLDPNWTDSLGYSLLLHALGAGDNPDVIGVILKGGGNPNTCHPRDPESVLDRAIQNKRAQAAEVLRTAGAKTYAELHNT